MAAEQSRQTQARVFRTEVVHRPDQEGASRQPFGFASECPCTPREAAQATAEGAVEPFDERRIDPACALRIFNHGRDSLRCALHEAPLDAADALARGFFHHLRDLNVGPFQQTATAFLRARLLLAETALICVG